jgi:hypothetical protein
MRRLLLALYPAKWRHRYGAEYLDLLRELPLSPRLVGDVLRGAARERVRAISTLAPAAKSALLVAAGLVLTCLFWACWHDIYAEADAGSEWRAATVTAVLLGLIGLLWVCRRDRATAAPGVLMVGASALALSWQYGVGGMPPWSAAVFPLQVALTAYAVALAGALAVFVRDVRRELRNATATATATSAPPPGATPAPG